MGPKAVQLLTLQIVKNVVKWLRDTLVVAMVVAVVVVAAAVVAQRSRTARSLCDGGGVVPNRFDLSTSNGKPKNQHANANSDAPVCFGRFLARGRPVRVLRGQEPAMLRKASDNVDDFGRLQSKQLTAKICSAPLFHLSPPSRKRSVAPPLAPPPLNARKSA